jgi:diacylglycerol kinase (ATP)
MNALAILGPRSRQSDLSLFENTPSLRVLRTPTAPEVTAALADADVVLVLGGDGTLHRHLNALVASGVTTLLVPSGSGNDFAAVNGIYSAKDAAQIFAEFLQAKLQAARADLGFVRSADGNQRHFSCCANVGLDADATRRANLLPAWIKARGGYLLGGAGAILGYRPRRLRVTRIVAGREEVMLDEAGWFAAVTNTPIYGGGLPIAPQASIWDGELDVTCLRATPRWNVVRHYPKILSGAHTRLPEILAFRAQRVRIETATPQPVYSDGDYVGETPCEVAVAPKALRILTRPGSGVGF